MTTKIVSPVSRVNGQVSVPGDKSISHRAVILGSLARGTSTVENFLEGEDCLCTLDAFRQMGVQIHREGNRLTIVGKGLDQLKRPLAPLNCGNSGTTTRLLMGVLTGQPFDVELTGDVSLSKRPMGRVIEPLSRMGAFFLSSAGRPIDPKTEARLPLRVQGSRNVRTLEWKSPVASAQVKSAILLAGLYASGPTIFEEPSLSRDHTERMMKACGVKIEREGFRTTIHGTATLRGSAFVVPGDLSSAAFLLAAGLLRGGTVVVKGVGINPTRTGFIDVVKAMGAQCRMDEATEAAGEPIASIVATGSPLKAVRISGDLIPRAIDEIPILTVLATQAKGETVIADAKELRVKESDRLATMCEELSKMGADLVETDDGLIIRGPAPLRGARVKSHGDHRLAMSLAVAALVAEGQTTIEDVDCVATSFPSFWDLLGQLCREA